MYCRAGHYIVPKRWTKPRRQCYTTTRRNRGEAGRSEGERRASGATEQRGCQPGRRAVGCQPVNSSRVPAGRGGAVGCQPEEEFLAVRCQLNGQYGASGRNREGGRGRIPNGLATTDKRATARAFGTTTRPGETVVLLTEAFPTRGTSPASRGLL